MKKIYGFDIGGTIIRPGYIKEKPPWPEAFRVIWRIVDELSPVAYIVSRVTEEQKVRGQAWLKQFDVHAITGIPPENVRWCLECKDKAPIVAELGITHFVDDRPEVMKYLAPEVVKIMIKPDPVHLWEHHKDITNYTVCSDWLDIEKFAFAKGQL